MATLQPPESQTWPSASLLCRPTLKEFKFAYYTTKFSDADIKADFRRKGQNNYDDVDDDYER